MKKAKIVVVGKYGQKLIGPFFKEGEDDEKADRFADDVNKLLMDPADKARVIPLGDHIPTPLSVAESLNEIGASPRLPFPMAPEISDELGLAPDGTLNVPRGSILLPGGTVMLPEAKPLLEIDLGITEEDRLSWGPTARTVEGPGEDENTDEDFDAFFDDSAVAADIDDVEPNKGD